MKDRSVSNSRGFRSIQVYTRSNDPKIGWTQSQTGQSGILTDSETFTCVNGTGGDKARRSATSYSFNKVRRTYGGGSIISGDQSLSYTVTTGAGFGTSMMPNGSEATFDESMSNVYNRALADLGDQLRGQLDLSIDLLEAKKTGSMIANLHIPRLYNYIRGFGIRNWSKKWLEYQYGWRPLVQSIYGAAAELNRQPKDGIQTLRARATESSTKFRENSSISGVFDQTRTTFSKRVEVQVTLDLSESFWLQASRISSLNPASIAWELTPYSFVADWVIDIGGYLRNLENAMMFDQRFLFGYVTSGTMKRSQSAKFGSHTTGAQSQTSYPGCEMYVTRSTKTRSALSSYPFPRLPSPKVDLGSARIISAGALLKEFFSRGKR